MDDAFIFWNWLSVCLCLQCFFIPVHQFFISSLFHFLAFFSSFVFVYFRFSCPSVIISISSALTKSTSVLARISSRPSPATTPQIKGIVGGVERKHYVKPLQFIWHHFPQLNERNTIHVDDLGRNFGPSSSLAACVLFFYRWPRAFSCLVCECECHLSSDFERWFEFDHVVLRQKQRTKSSAPKTRMHNSITFRCEHKVTLASKFEQS